MKDINLITAGSSVCDAGKIGSFLYAGCPIWVADNESEEKELIKSDDEEIKVTVVPVTDEEIAEITEAMNSHVSEEKIKDCLKLPPEKLRLMLQFYVQQQHKKGA